MALAFCWCQLVGDGDDEPPFEWVGDKRRPELAYEEGGPSVEPEVKAEPHCCCCCCCW